MASPKLLQEFECVILEVRGDEFEARLADMTNPDYPDEVAIIGINKIADEDREWVKEGAVFYWKITQLGDQDPVSKLEFRKEYWTEEELQRAAAKATEWLECINDPELV